MIAKVLTVVAFIFGSFCAFAQTVQDVAVTVQCVADSSSTKIKLVWQSNDAGTSHQVFRKLKGGNSWGSAIANLPGSATEYVDNTSVIGLSYEYQIVRNTPTISGAGYINAGLKVRNNRTKGKMILLVDETIEAALVVQIGTLMADLEGDGWQIIYLSTPRDAQPKTVKERIRTVYNLDKPNTKALFILGHVPVPYSGSIAPDGHPDHQGAWPADAYYGEMDGVWTDAQLNTEVASDPRNRNIIGDGKFDQSLFPSNIELQVGRVDFFNMPDLLVSEQDLLLQYLKKLSEYKHKNIDVNVAAVVDDNFGYFSGEAFAVSPYRTLGGLVGIDSVIQGDYIESMKSKSYQWSYGCGGGSYQSAGGIGSTQSLFSGNPKGIFTMLFGSYFGDWDSRNNFLRGALASGTILTNVWAGRPAWYFHHMGLGENIGFSTRVNQNNDNSQYRSHYGTKFIHMALMGDPSLRQHIVKPVQDVETTQEVSDVRVSWTPAVFNPKTTSYEVFVKRPNQLSFVYLGKSDILTPYYVDSCQLILGQHVYMVKVEELTVCPSGSYYNTSLGFFDTISIASIPMAPRAVGTLTLVDNFLTCTNLSTNSSTYLWDFGDGFTSTDKSPSHVYDSLGSYTITLIAFDGCRSDTLIQIVKVLTSTDDYLGVNGWSVFPNPTKQTLTIINSNGLKVNEIEIFMTSGGSILKSVFSSQIDVGTLHSGIYIARIKANDGSTQLIKFVKI